MTGAIVSASTGVMGSLLAKLSTLLREECKLLKSVKGDIRFLRDELSTMNTLLLKLSNMEENLDDQVKEWRNKVRELSYDIEDCIDHFMHKQARGGAKANIVSKTADKIKKLLSRHQIAGQIQELKTRVEEASDRRLRYNFDQYNAQSTVKVDPRLPFLYADAKRLVGIDGPMEKIIESLMKGVVSSEQLKVVSIVGFGGLGKTTLANQVYLKIKDKFDCTAFVSISRSPNVKKILADMLKEVGIRGDTSDDEKQLIDQLREHLHNKRYFVIVDDIWSTDTWEIVKSALPENSLCSRIITTTRNVVVAKSCCSGFQDHMYEIQPLSEQDSRKLFFKRLFHSESFCPPQLEEVSYATIKKCCGLPLAIISISSLLASKPDTKEQWEQVQNSIGSAFSSKGMREILLLSYYDLPYHLKTCLLYLSIFPEDYIIEREELIWRWIAEGFITEVKGQTLEQVGENYFNELVNRSMIQPVDIQYDGRAEACRLHDMVLELIVSLSAEENFVTIVDGQEYNCSSNKIRRLSLQSDCVGREAMQQITNNCSQVRSLIFHRMDKETPPLPLSQFRSLRVLDFGYCEGLSNQHIKYIGSFFQLKFLRISYGAGVTELPDEIGGLQYLQTLNIRGSGIEKLPSTIRRLRSLVRLLVNYDIELPDDIGDLHALKVLSGVGYSSVKFVEELRRLTKLRELKIGLFGSRSLRDDGIRMYEEALELSLTVLGKHGLQSLDIRCSGYLRDKLLDLLCRTAPCLRKLAILGVSNSRLSQRVVSLVNIAHLDVCVSTIKQEDLCVLGGIPTLLYLRLYLRDAPGQRLTIGSQRFQCLKEFEFECYSGGGELSMVCEQEAMPMLRRLHVELGAKETESKMGFEHLGSLEHLSVIINCEDATRREVEAAEAAIRNAASIHPGHPTLEIRKIFEGCRSGRMDEEEREVRLEGGVDLDKEVRQEHS